MHYERGRGVAPAVVDEADEDGWTPLLAAAEHGHTEIAGALLAAKARPLLSRLRPSLVLVHLGRCQESLSYVFLQTSVEV